MYETFVGLTFLNNHSSRRKTVKVERNFVNAKAETTYVGTIVMNPTNSTLNLKMALAYINH